jgi:antitoxin (DNA-binding transcriptional repressor) of toxin-antitoxin stability system
MKTLSVAELKSQFASVVSDLRQGEEIAITYGRSRKPLGTIIPQSKLKKPDYSVKLGDLQDAGWTYKMKDFDMTDEELLAS